VIDDSQRRLWCMNHSSFVDKIFRSNLAGLSGLELIETVNQWDDVCAYII
jgi:hypothetical protein